MWLDRAVKWLLPREEHFFDLLERGSLSASNCSRLMLECCSAGNLQARESFVQKMAEEEHEGDRVIHDMYEALNKTFVTPLDRSDIYALATDLENITDAIHATSNHILVHAMDDLPAGSIELARLIVDATEHLHQGVKKLRGLKNLHELRAHCSAVNRLESEGDRIFRGKIGELFRTEKDAIKLLKYKEFLEGLERTLDVCDDVANALETIIIKNG